MIADFNFIFQPKPISNKSPRFNVSEDDLCATETGSLRPYKTECIVRKAERTKINKN